MNTALLLARLLLVLVFAVAGAAKLADREGSRQAIVNFGVPSALAAPPRAPTALGRTGRRRISLAVIHRLVGKLGGARSSLVVRSWH